MVAPQDNVLQKGSVINNTYEVQCFIGRGAFGEVYRVKHKFLGLQVLKLLRESYVENSDLDTLSTEARILSGLTHKNIVRVFETNTFELDGLNHFFITMGFVSGESLAQLLHREIILSVPVTLSIQMAVLKGLKEVHSQIPPVIHRDISPDNILLSYDDDNQRALLSDFGLAQSVEQMSEIAGAGGKYLYMAPECFWDVYLPASDIFSAGIVLYRMLTGLYPWSYDFDSLDDGDVDAMTTMVMKARKKSIVPPSHYNEECSEYLDRVVLKALSLDLELRYRNAVKFLDELELEVNRVTLKSNDQCSLYR